MLKHDPFYHKSLRKVTAIFGTLFNDIFIVRKDNSDIEKERIKVPIQYAPKEKWFIRGMQDPDLNREVAIQLPRMSFIIDSFTYDGSRSRVKIKKHVKDKDNSTRTILYDGVPYTLQFKLWIAAKNQDDANQIFEQIVPFFKPDYTPTYIPLEEWPDIKDDLPIILKNVSLDDNYDENWNKRRMIVYTLTFDVKMFFYGPFQDQKLVTKQITDLLVAPGVGPVTDEEVATTPRSVRITVTPDPPTAGPDDDFGYITEIEEFFDGKKRNPVTGEDEEIT